MRGKFGRPRPKPALIGDKGEVWPEPSLELRRQLHCLDYPGDLATDVIRNLGFIGCCWRGSELTLRLNGRNMAGAALAAVIYLIRDHQPGRVVISFVGDQWPDEMIANEDYAIARLSAIHNAAETERRIRVRHGEPSLLHQSSPLLPLFERWRDCQGVCSGAELARVANEHLDGRYLVIGVADLEFTAEDWGAGFQVPDPKWNKQARGQRISDIGDSIYFQWVYSCYRDTLNSKRPNVADIDAEINWRRSGRERRLYTRMLLPCLDTENGPLFLFSANTTVGNINTRLRQAS